MTDLDVRVSTASAPAVAASSSRRWWVLAVLGIAQLMVVLDATIVNIALPHAQSALHFSNGDRQWIVTAYSLAFGSLLLLAGRIADLFGRKRVFLVGVIGFAVFLATLQIVSDETGLPYRYWSRYTASLDRKLRSGPVLLSITDIHWADPGVLALFEHLLAALAHSAFLLVTTNRPDPDLVWPPLSTRSSWNAATTLSGFAGFTAIDGSICVSGCGCLASIG